MLRLFLTIEGLIETFKDECVGIVISNSNYQF